MNFVCALRDVIIAILRLIMLQLVLFVTGLHHILFNRMEVSNIQLMVIPQRRDRDRLAFVDDLKANNFDLITKSPLPPADCMCFVEDDDIDDIEFTGEDFDDNEDDDSDNNEDTK